MYWKCNSKIPQKNTCFTIIKGIFTWLKVRINMISLPLLSRINLRGENWVHNSPYSYYIYMYIATNFVILSPKRRNYFDKMIKSFTDQGENFTSRLKTSFHFIIQRRCLWNWLWKQTSGIILKLQSIFCFKICKGIVLRLSFEQKKVAFGQIRTIR